MITVLRLVPVVLSCLLMAAHFLRSGLLVLTAAFALLPLLLAVRRPWVPPVMQAVLLVAGAEWVRTTVVLACGRMAAGEPWTRMALILGSVLAVTLGSMLVFRHSAVRGRYARS